MNHPTKIFPRIDPRIIAVGTSKLREFDAEFLRAMGDKLYLIHDAMKPVAVLIGYGQYMAINKIVAAAQEGDDEPTYRAN